MQLIDLLKYTIKTKLITIDIKQKKPLQSKGF